MSKLVAGLIAVLLFAIAPKPAEAQLNFEQCKLLVSALGDLDAPFSGLSKTLRSVNYAPLKAQMSHSMAAATSRLEKSGANLDSALRDYLDAANGLREVAKICG